MLLNLPILTDMIFMFVRVIQLSRGRGRQIFEFEGSMAYRASFRKDRESLIYKKSFNHITKIYS